VFAGENLTDDIERSALFLIHPATNTLRPMVRSHRYECEPGVLTTQPIRNTDRQALCDPAS